MYFIIQIEQKIKLENMFCKNTMSIFTAFQSSHKSLRESSFNPIPGPVLRPASDKNPRISSELII